MKHGLAGEPLVHTCHRAHDAKRESIFSNRRTPSAAGIGIGSCYVGEGGWPKSAWVLRHAVAITHKSGINKHTKRVEKDDMGGRRQGFELWVFWR